MAPPSSLKTFERSFLMGRVSKVERIIQAAVSLSIFLLLLKAQLFVIASIMHRLSTTVPIYVIYFTH